MLKHSLNYFISAEAFQYNVYHFQCFAVPIKLAVVLVVFPVIEVLNDQLHHKTHTLFDAITHICHTVISANSAPIKRKTSKITVSYGDCLAL